MNANTMKRLEYDKIKEKLEEYAISYIGKSHVRIMEPSDDKKRVERMLNEADEARIVLDHGASVPIPSMEGLEPVMQLIGTGYVLSENELTLVARLIESTVQLMRFMEKREPVAPTVSGYAKSLHELKGLRSEIERCIRHGRVDDHASKELAKIRSKITIAEERVKKKLESAMNKYRSYLQESVVSMRNGRYVLAVKKEHRKLVAGTVLDESASGQTVFMQLHDIAGQQLELAELRAEEAIEEGKVLGMLTGLVEESKHELSVNMETLGYYDFLFAKAKLAKTYDGRKVALNTEGRMAIKSGRHPLLGGKSVPLDFRIGGAYRTLIITGPNTGGKTVSLKTIGLLTLMAQSGLLVPVGEGSRLAVYTHVAADIGDGQSIEQSLSTFSSHIRNVIEILKTAGPSTLVLLDELATGTDPGEGVGLSIAVLEELHRRGTTVVATTHYNEIKNFAERTPGFQNARMEFDTETLQPLYKLRIGEAGQSYAFFIAQKLGMPEAIVERSREIAAGAGAAAAADRGGESERLSNGADAERASQDGDWPESWEDDGEAAEADAGSADAAKAEPAEAAAEENESADRPLQKGDCVWIQSLGRTGIVSELPDARGNVIVLVQKQQVKINVKRISLYIESSKLYPGDDYDMDIVFESKDVRKKRKLMSRKHVEGLMIEKPYEK
ncbi:endonuclease MutS2 [Paenibacillus contaminans]|uniref:DNA mismatch repair protein MutS n=1 Tax=Paenibacillus contaminans TaxID=450362 RepID=A0A329M2W2_9BACL|nr:DNA mismatch repair protein MutS [Paenibacillus contaminans]RAV12963.1 DNA mismatch repair protein MutS [Paenibacillus contaminans]